MHNAIDIAILQAYIAHINNVNGVSEMRYVNGQIVLNKKETADMLFALVVVENNQNSYGATEKKANKQSVSAYHTLRMVSVRLGVIE